jgi:hypothetical protein
MLAQSLRTGVEALIACLATGRVDTLDGNDFFDLPAHGRDNAE